MEENNDPIQNYDMSKKKKQAIQDEVLREYMKKNSKRFSERLKWQVIGYSVALLVLIPIGIIVSYRDAKNREQINEVATIINNATEHEVKTPLNVIEKIEIQKEELAIDKREDSYYDSLKLQVGDLYNVYSKEGKIVVFCSVISGEEPKIGEVFHIESKASSDLVYEATVYDVRHELDSFGKEYLQVYFDGVETEMLAFTPEIRRVK